VFGGVRAAESADWELRRRVAVEKKILRFWRGGFSTQGCINNEVAVFLGFVKSAQNRAFSNTFAPLWRGSAPELDTV
jgi:hypothetical protein